MRFLFLPLPVSLLALAAIPACGKSSSSGGSPAASCPAPFADGGLQPFESAADGTVSGTGLSAYFCNVGVPISPTSFPPSSGPVNVTFDSSEPATAFHVEVPSVGTGGSLTGSIQIAAPTPGVYKSSDAAVCGSVTFSYGVLVDGGADCVTADAESSTGTTCPAACVFSFACPSSPPCCVPLATTYIFQAVSTTACGGGPTTTPLGSWTLTISNVATEDDAGFYSQGPAYVAHGTLEATLQGTSGVDEPVTLSLSF